uniref:Aquaporin n=1 Tax=Chlamydomonas euryale TaxID=1486919 RepID=A0A7R9YUK4_9CHLO|mmetsp:Transcript_25640/g.75811  ORF Transcript_25640/g.75811 Transcript_25640/m.75811 type:complete len:335 (+) Transcript_25640:428-1432(+)
MHRRPAGTAITLNNRPIARQAINDDNEGIRLEEIARVNLYMGSWTVSTALAFGFAITVLAYATAGLSGGQMNPAVTFGLWLAGALSWMQAIGNSIAQVIGAIIGAAFLMATMPNGNESTLGSNSITSGVGIGNALCGEIVMTFVLVLVVLETAVSGKEMVQMLAPLAIGFAVFCAHTVLLPIDGCSINPARSLGPAIVSSTWPDYFWVFVIGPYIGAIVAVPIHIFFRWEFEEVNNDTRPRRMFSLRRPVVENQLPALNLRRRNSDEPSNLPSPTHDAINIVNIERASMVRESNRASMPRESAFAIPVARDLPESTSENVLPEVHVEMLESKTK